MYAIDTIGTDYTHTISILKNDSSRTLETCFFTNSAPNETPIAYSFTAGKTYLIGVSDWAGGGNLTIKVTKKTCIAGALCVTATGHNKWSERYTEVKILDPQNNVIGEGWGDGSGFTTVPGVPPGNYTVITSAWGFFIINQNVKVPGICPSGYRGQYPTC